MRIDVDPSTATSVARTLRVVVLVVSLSGSGVALAASPGASSETDNADAPDDGNDAVERRLDANARAGGQAEKRLKAVRERQRQAALRAHAKESRDEIIIIGSSSVNGALGRRLEAGLEREGFKATRWGRSASGLSRLDYYDWFDALLELSIGPRTAGVIVYLGVNDPQGIWLYPYERKTADKWVRFHHKDEWEAKYRERVVILIDALCAFGVPKVAMLTPVDVRWSRLQERLVRIRRLQIEGARQPKCGVAVSGSGDSLLLAEPERGEPKLRMRDGYHLSATGGDLVWDRIKYRALRIFTGRPWLQIADVPDVRARQQPSPVAARRAPRPRAAAASGGGRSAPQGP